MGPFTELLSADHRQTLEFFYVGLKDVSEPTVDYRELLYNASVLANYAQISTQTSVDVPTPATLSTVFDSFFWDTTLVQDSRMMETAAAQCLLLTGFFEDQLRGRHNIGWYATLGAGFFSRAASQEPSLPKAHLLDTMAKTFEVWRRRYATLSRDLHDQPYLLAAPLARDRRGA